MSKGTIFAFSSGDVLITLFLDDNTDMVVPAKRFVCETFPNGDAYGIMEIGTDIYDDNEIEILDESKLSGILNDCREMDIVVATKPMKSRTLASKEITSCKKCTFIMKRTSIAFPNTVTNAYYFSNIPGKFNFDLELPKPEVSLNPDPLYRIARALEDIKKLKAESEDDKKQDDVVLTIEEYTALLLDGKVPKRYADGGIFDVME